jgi:hypothetical protein
MATNMDPGLRKESARFDEILEKTAERHERDQQDGPSNGQAAAVPLDEPGLTPQAISIVEYEEPTFWCTLNCELGMSLYCRYK